MVPQLIEEAPGTQKTRPSGRSPARIDAMIEDDLDKHISLFNQYPWWIQIDNDLVSMHLFQAYRQHYYKIDENSSRPFSK